MFPQLKSKVLELPYMHGNMTLYVILPNDCDGVNDVQHALKTFNLAEFNKIGTHRVNVRLPKFRIVFATFLKQALTNVSFIF